jgi:hypothetical protein
MPCRPSILDTAGVRRATPGAIVRFSIPAEETVISYCNRQKQKQLTTDEYQGWAICEPGAICRFADYEIG